MTLASPQGPIVVMKFGGTSVATPVTRHALGERVAAALDAGERPVVVVSAMGRAGDPYATDTMLGLLGEGPVDPAEQDLLASCGEVISAVLVAHGLRAAGIAARAFTGATAGIRTDDRHTEATILDVDVAALQDAIDGGFVPVVTGFQGVDASGHVTTLGRGGSDTTACALAVALRAARAEIYTDVDGVMSADPRVCDGARVLESLQFEELFQMARGGAKVMHAPAAEAAMEGGVPVVVRSTTTRHPGTLISAESAARSTGSRVATAVTHATGITRYVVALPPTPDREPAVTALFRALADAGASLDMFTPLGDALAFSVEDGGAPTAEATLRALGLSFTSRDHLAKVTLVGAGMHGVPGVMARIAEALSAEDIPILQVADSHYTIAVLVDGRDARPAVEALHRTFGLGVE